ncbi:MAG: hypothetical protein HXX16_01925 [Bacteroidales bacterium]|nr:hypothetical protein [Bacteroidales bacterium]
MKEPIVALLKILLHKNSIRVNEEELQFQLLSHPSYPSLHSITGVLDHFSIKNYALEIPKTVETLNLLPNSFLAVIKTENYNGFVLVCKHNLGFHLYFDGTKKEILSTDNFLDVWTGIIVIIENDQQEVVPEPKKAYFPKSALYIITLIIFVVFCLYRTNLFQTIHFILTLAGAAICVLILQHELGLHSKVLDKFCSETSKKTSCNAVLNSKGATLFGTFKFSDVGIIYFVSLLLSWALLIFSKSSYNSIVLITVLAIPFTFFSIYYQYKVVKKWCLLCLSVVSVLWLQAAALYFIDFKIDSFQLNFSSTLFTALSFLATLSIWQFISPKLKKEQELHSLKVEHYKFKRNFNIFKSLTFRTEIVPTDIYDINEIVFGESPLLKIVIITNPLCGFCKEAHELVENLLKRKDKNVQITIRFNVKDDYNSVDTRIALKLIEIYNKDGEQLCLESMHEIYGKISAQDWFYKWGEPKEQKYIETLTKEKTWCEQNGINFTPEILVNGRSFPKEYNRTDLLYFIDDIIEEETEKANLQMSEIEIEA